MPKQLVLHLNLKHGFFDAIATKEKRTEYRSRTPYWKRRLLGRRYDAICFRNGYSKNAPEMIVQFLGMRSDGSDFAIRLGRILKIKRWHRKRRTNVVGS